MNAPRQRAFVGDEQTFAMSDSKKMPCPKRQTRLRLKHSVKLMESHITGKESPMIRLTSIHIRRTSNFFASAIRRGTTKHLKPHAEQKVKWTSSPALNTAALAAKEMGNAFKAVPVERG